jgi:hypothetical protein
MRFARRNFAAACFLVGSAAIGAVADPGPAILPPARITLKQADATLGDVAAAISKASGIAISADSAVAKVRCPMAFDGTPLWEALEKSARDADAKLVVGDGGRKITFAPRGASKEVSAISGPFRVAVKSVTGRLLLDSGAAFHELHLIVHWEPRYPVFRIDSNPKITAAKFDKTNDLLSDAGVSRHHPSGAMTEMVVRLAGLPRRAAKIDVIAGQFRATAAPKMLTIKFDDLAAASPIDKKADGVSARMKPFTFDDTTKTWDVELELAYPPGGPEFESFEEHKWLRDNRIQLVSPQGKPFDPDSEEVLASGNRKVTATYRFKVANPKAKGWSLVYVIPAPLVEVTVPFRLENIPVP